LEDKLIYRAPAKNGDSANPIKNLTANIPAKLFTPAVERERPPQTIIAQGK
jgi:hypothetical protein